jgi:hypothetical protein
LRAKAYLHQQPGIGPAPQVTTYPQQRVPTEVLRQHNCSAC